jgi:hypothetical protein
MQHEWMTARPLRRPDPSSSPHPEVHLCHLGVTRKRTIHTIRRQTVHKTHLISLSLIILAAALLVTGCVTGKCADAVDHAEKCGVSNLELEDDLSGCSDHWECRSVCVLNAPCDEVKRSFGAEHDRTTAAWKCYEKCPLSD